MTKISAVPKKSLLSIFKQMCRIRLFEEKIIELYPRQEMKTPVHLCVGQEAIAAGVCEGLREDDLVFSNHRNHGHCIAKGMDMSTIMAELYGKATGCSAGKGGSMHLADSKHGIYGTSAIVAGGIPLAVGAGLALTFKRTKRISVAFFGDGAVDTGVFYESLNFASLKRLPVIFICENNFYATNSPLLSRQPADNIYRRVMPLGVESLRVDGNDACAVFIAAQAAIKRARNRAGPTFIECRTYRLRQHVGCGYDHVTGCRPHDELRAWMKCCPIQRLEYQLLRSGLIDRYQIKRMRGSIVREIEKALDFAARSPFPKNAELLTYVY